MPASGSGAAEPSLTSSSAEESDVHVSLPKRELCLRVTLVVQACSSANSRAGLGALVTLLEGQLGRLYGCESLTRG